jgi:hypothetical protein
MSSASILRLNRLRNGDVALVAHSERAPISAWTGRSSSNGSTAFHVGRPAFAQDRRRLFFKQLNVVSLRLAARQRHRNPRRPEGDQVILSDTSACDSHDRIRLN